MSYPDVSSLARLAEIFGVSVDDLLKCSNKTLTDNNHMKDIVNLIFKAVALAMGTAVTVLMILNEISLNQSVIMLSIGLVSLSFYLFSDEKH